MRQNSIIKVLQKGNKVYGESEMAAFDRRHKLIQPQNLTNLITLKLKLINLTTVLLLNSASSAVHNQICCNLYFFFIMQPNLRRI